MNKVWFREGQVVTAKVAHNQVDEQGKTAFERLCEELDVALVTHETDLAILQTLAAVPTAVGITNDRYADYAKTFPSLVGSPRLRGFSVTRIGGKSFVLVDGLVQAIAVEAKESQVVEEASLCVKGSEMRSLGGE